MGYPYLMDHPTHRKQVISLVLSGWILHKSHKNNWGFVTYWWSTRYITNFDLGGSNSWLFHPAIRIPGCRTIYGHLEGGPEGCKTTRFPQSQATYRLHFSAGWLSQRGPLKWWEVLCNDEMFRVLLTLIEHNWLNIAKYDESATCKNCICPSCEE